MQDIKINDILEQTYLSDIKVSDDAVIFLKHHANADQNDYDHDLYMYRDLETIALTNDHNVHSYEVNGQEVIFISSKDEKAKDETVFYKISLRGGEAREYFRTKLKVTSFKMIDDDHLLLSVNESHDEEKREGYEVFTKLPFYMNGSGYLQEKTTRLYLYRPSTNQYAPITAKDLDIDSYRLQKTKDKILYVAHASLRCPSFKNSLHLFDFRTQEDTELIKEEDYMINDAFFIKDRIVFIGNREVRHGINENDRFFIIDEGVHLLYDNEDSLYNSIGSDVRLGHSDSFFVHEDKLYMLKTIMHYSEIASLDLDGKNEEIFISGGSIDHYALVDDKIYLIGLFDGALQELYVYTKDHQLKKLTSFNDHLLEDHYIARPERIVFSNDDTELEGWVLLPKDHDPQKSYPAILDIHGGPKTVYGEVYYHEMQVWANKGYFVMFCDPRGSDGRGNEFMDIFGRYGTIDYEDIMKFVDTVLEKFPTIDRNRLGVTGGSYGGFMTNWIIGHTDRFKCAATQRSISDWISFYGTSDIGYYFTTDQIKAGLDNIEKLWWHSPLKYIDSMTTPTLFIHSDEDYRCPLSQGLELYTALIKKGVEARFVLFHHENHELSRSGRPKNRIKRLEEITAWFDRHLK